MKKLMRGLLLVVFFGGLLGLEWARGFSARTPQQNGSIKIRGIHNFKRYL